MNCKRLLNLQGVLLWTACLLAAASANGPLCLHCNLVDKLGNCDNVVQCADTEMCFVDKFQSRTSTSYSTGCRNKVPCEIVMSHGVVGRRQPAEDIRTCTDCCNGSFCNDRQLCHDTSVFQGPACFSCDMIDAPENCYKIKRCQANEVCYTGKASMNDIFLYYRMGCAPANNKCTPEHAPDHLEFCQSCCPHDFCNRDVNRSSITCEVTGTRPVITRPLVSQSRHRLDAVDLYCEAKGTPPPVLTWLYNGRPVSLPSVCDGNHLACLTNDNKTLSLHAVDSHDSGNYTCRATNRYGVATTTASLDVDGPPIVGISGWTMPQIGALVQLECNVTGAMRPHHLVWAKKGGSLSADSHILDYNNLAGLTFTYQDAHNSGIYRCVDNNSPEKPYAVVGVVHNLNLLSCNSVYKDCPAIGEALCGGTCPDHCGYTERLQDIFPLTTNICKGVTLDISFNGGQVVWEMQYSAQSNSHLVANLLTI